MDGSKEVLCTEKRSRLTLRLLSAQASLARKKDREARSEEMFATHSSASLSTGAARTKEGMRSEWNIAT